MRIEAVQPAVDRADHHHIVADGRRGEQFGIDLRAPQLTSRGAVQRNDRALAAACHDDAEARRGSRGYRYFQLLDPYVVAGIERHGDHLALVARREYQAVVDCRTQPQAQLDLLLAAADTFAPEFLDRQ